ncbi:uncharacterized protein LOC110094341 [Dendrobium catenatum]|uniref:uncharacterized protein LOC110094341 n=1 Tax=Dendrobium catenatum TaxID=906689 RepID=UPI0010A01EC6|nr:uncharacterized protein LOC110094341 [Dendrobium catenatum]
MVSWKDTCKPKIYGGLGIPSVDAMHFAFCCNTVWRFFNSKSYLFGWWKGKYGSFWNSSISKRSIYWKALCDVANSILSSIKFNTTPYSTLSFLCDPWCYGQSIAERLKDFNLEIPSGHSSLTISSFITNDIWNLPSYIPFNLADVIHSVPICYGLDDCCWAKSEKPSFKNFLKDYYVGPDVVSWYKYVWHRSFAMRFLLYSWFVFKKGLKKADALLARSISVNPLCIFCKAERETQNHLFFECDFSFNILKSFMPRMNFMLLHPNLWQVFNDIEDREFDINRKNLCFLLISAIVYFIWRARNDRIFGNITESHTAIALKIKSAVYLKSYKKKCFNSPHILFS